MAHMELENNGVHAEENGMDVAGEHSPYNTGISDKKRKRRETLTPIIERPARERKSVDRFVASAEKETKEFKFEKGSGTALKDIPNVVYKISKRKGTDEVVQLLHRILYGKQAKSHAVKSNILQFSGYVWGENEEKDKSKIKEKLEKCRKEILVQISELVDLNLFKSTKKEDVVLKLFKFLESPYKTTDKLLEEKIKDSKMKRMKKKLAKTNKKRTPQKKKSQEKKASSDKENSDEEDDYGSSDEEDNVEEDVDSEDNSEDDDYKDFEVSKKKQQSSNKPTQNTRKKDSKDKLDASSLKTKEIINTEIQVTKAVNEPSDDELQTVIRELLQEADFTKVTLADVLRQIGNKFSIDLSQSKARLRALIQSELASMAESGNNDGEGEDGKSEDGNNDGEDEDGNKDGEGEDGKSDDKGQFDKNEGTENKNANKGDAENVGPGGDGYNSEDADNCCQNEEGNSGHASNATENVNGVVDNTIVENENILNGGEDIEKQSSATCKEDKVSI